MINSDIKLLLINLRAPLIIRKPEIASSFLRGKSHLELLAMTFLEVALIVLLGSTLIQAEPNSASITLEPGKEVRLNAGKNAGEILVFVPTDYNDQLTWPIVFFYHGMGGQLSTNWLQAVTEGKGFVLVSIEYTKQADDKMTPPEYRAFLQKEVENLAYVRHFLQGKLNIDPKKTILAGISKGGWQAGNIFASRPQLAVAGIITLAGNHAWVPETPLLMKGKYVYIGAGETDENLPAALRSVQYFKNRGAEVTAEIYKGRGHEVDPNAVKLKKWFSDLRLRLNQSSPIASNKYNDDTRDANSGN
jgi:predicted esterase